MSACHADDSDSNSDLGVALFPKPSLQLMHLPGIPLHNDEIRMLENHKKLMQKQIDAIERKVTALKSVK
jgi:hypothetical protein